MNAELPYDNDCYQGHAIIIECAGFHSLSFYRVFRCHLQKAFQYYLCAEQLNLKSKWPWPWPLKNMQGERGERYEVSWNVQRSYQPTVWGWVWWYCQRNSWCRKCKKSIVLWRIIEMLEYWVERKGQEGSAKLLHCRTGWSCNRPKGSQGHWLGNSPLMGLGTNLIRDCEEQNQGIRGILLSFLGRPSQSPHLYPIAILWSILDLNLKDRKP